MIDLKQDIIDRYNDLLNEFKWALEDKQDEIADLDFEKNEIKKKLELAVVTRDHLELLIETLQKMNPTKLLEDDE